MKYDAQIADLKTQLQNATRVLVMLPTQASVDVLASGLSLYLALKQSGKQASIASDADLKVSQSNLFGVGDITNTVTSSGAGGNLTLSLEGVVDNDGKVPALEKLDWFPEGNNLNLVFHVLPGQKFEPINIGTKYEGGNFDLIFTVGASNVQALGQVYASQADKLNSVPKVNIDRGNSNSLFGQTNVVDANASSLSEMVMQLIQGLNLPQDADIASNIIAGIYGATANLTQNTNADTFIALGQAMQLGGKTVTTNSIPDGGFDISKLNQAALTQAQPAPAPVQTPAPQVFQAPQPHLPQPEAPKTGDLVERKSEDQQAQQLQQALNPSDVQQQAAQQYIKSQFETPTGEYVSSGNPESPASPAPDWLTPKIFKGGNLS